MAYSGKEAKIRSFFATAAGVVLTAGVLLYALTDTPPKRRAGHWTAMVLISGISFLFNALPEVGGAFQLWDVGFAWLV